MQYHCSQKKHSVDFELASGTIKEVIHALYESALPADPIWMPKKEFYFRPSLMLCSLDNKFLKADSCAAYCEGNACFWKEAEVNPSSERQLTKCVSSIIFATPGESSLGVSSRMSPKNRGASVKRR